MKKSYMKKNLLVGVLAYLGSGWEKKDLSFIACETQDPLYITSLSGDIVYFTFSECPGLYDDFIIRFGSNVSRETIQDIDVFRVCKKNGKDGKVIRYRYDYSYTVRVEKKCICAILAELLLCISFILK